MKKGQSFEGTIERIDFPNKGIIHIEDTKVVVKNGLLGQKVTFSITKARNKKFEGRITEILKPSPFETRDAECEHFGPCGGCTYQTFDYEKQLELKRNQVKELIDSVCSDYVFEGILQSPLEWEYRNKMEFSFGDEFKDGPLALGLHKKGSFHDIVTASGCKIVHGDFNQILCCVLEYFQKLGTSYYHKLSHEGFLRHLIIRRASKTKEILINLVTSTQEMADMGPLTERLLGLSLQGTIAGILHTSNDSQADIVQNDSLAILYGKDYFYEELLGLKFKISAFSFFQTNSLGAEVLYSKVREYIGETKDKLIFDLYSGTGTIAQLAAPVAKKVIGVEIVAEAVDAAKKNASLNSLTNTQFIAGDVLKVLDELEDQPDLIILDPPRDGIHPKALKKILDYNVNTIIYISCKPTSLARDLAEFMDRGYQLVKACAVDMFPQTVHVETVVLLEKKG